MVKPGLIFSLAGGCTFTMILMLQESVFFFYVMDSMSSINPIRFIQYAVFVGRVFGSFLYCFISEIFGQTYALSGATLPFIISCGISQITENYAWMCIAGILLGLASGGASTVLPIYISEISPKSSRGLFVVITNSFLLSGSFLLQSIQPNISLDIFTSILNYKSIILGVIIGLVFSLCAVKSPLYHLSKGEENSDNETLKQLNVEDTQIELNKLKCTPTINQTNIYQSNDKVMSCLKSHTFLKAWLMMLSLVKLHPFCGIESASFYGFQAKSVPVLVGNISTWITSLMTALSTVACMFAVDRIGRKKCLIISFGGMAVCLIYFCIIRIFVIIYGMEDNYYFYIPFVILYYSFYNFGAGPIPQVLVGEIFPLRIKMLMSAFFTALMTVLHFMGPNLLITFYWFEISLYINVVTCILIVIIVYFLFLETSNKSFYEIQLDLKRF